MSYESFEQCVRDKMRFGLSIEDARAACEGCEIDADSGPQPEAVPEPYEVADDADEAPEADLEADQDGGGGSEIGGGAA